jgi:hypothetical protein
MLGGMSEVAELVVIKTHLSRGLASRSRISASRAVDRCDNVHAGLFPATTDSAA